MTDWTDDLDERIKDAAEKFSRAMGMDAIVLEEMLRRVINEPLPMDGGLDAEGV